MLNLERSKQYFNNNVLNKFYAESYFVQKKYSEDNIKQYYLNLDLFKLLNLNFEDEEKVQDLDFEIGNITINNNYNTYIPNGTSSYTHTQTTESLEWTVIHNLGYYPSQPRIQEESGRNIEGVIQDQTIYSLKIIFNHPQKGKAYFS